MTKKSFPLSKVYSLLEPGPVVLMTTAGQERPNIMAMSWHTMIEFEPPLVGCVISNRNHTFNILKATKECVIKYNFFILEVLKAWIDPSRKQPRTIHHLGLGAFMVAGRTIKLEPPRLDPVRCRQATRYSASGCSARSSGLRTPRPPLFMTCV